MTEENKNSESEQEPENQEPAEDNSNSFVDFEKAMSEEKETSSFEFLTRPIEEEPARSRARDDKGRFATQNKEVKGEPEEEANAPEEEEPEEEAEPEKKPPRKPRKNDGLGPFKKRLERERRKMEAKDKEIERLKSQLAANQEPDNEPQANPEGEPEDTDMEEPTAPERDAFPEGEEGDQKFKEAEDKYIDDLVDWWEHEEKQGGKKSEPEQKREPQNPEQNNEPEPVTGKETPLTEKTNADQTLWLDMMEVVDEYDGENENLLDDLKKGIADNTIVITRDMAEWLVDNEDMAGKVVEQFVEKPRLSRKVSRTVGSRTIQMLKEMSREQGNKKTPKKDPVQTIDSPRGASRAPEKPLGQIKDFSEFESRMNRERKDSPWGF